MNDKNDTPAASRSFVPAVQGWALRVAVSLILYSLQKAEKKNGYVSENARKTSDPTLPKFRKFFPLRRREEKKPSSETR